MGPLWNENKISIERWLALPFTEREKKIQSRLDTLVRTWCVCCRDGSATYAWILAIHIARMIPNGSNTSKTTPCNAPRFQAKAPSHRTGVVVEF